MFFFVGSWRLINISLFFGSFGLKSVTEKKSLFFFCLKKIKDRWGLQNKMFRWVLVAGFSNRQFGTGILRGFATSHRIGPRWISQWVFLLRIFAGLTLSTTTTTNSMFRLFLLNSTGNQSQASDIQLNHFLIHFGMSPCWSRPFPSSLSLSLSLSLTDK